MILSPGLAWFIAALSSDNEKTRISAAASVPKPNKNKSEQNVAFDMEEKLLIFIFIHILLAIIPYFRIIWRGATGPSQHHADLHRQKTHFQMFPDPFGAIDP